MKPVYEVRLRSKNKNRIGSDTPRDFGGVIPGRMEHTMESVVLRSKTDRRALDEARDIARQKDSNIMHVSKTWSDFSAD